VVFRVKLAARIRIGDLPREGERPQVKSKDAVVLGPSEVETTGY
jgi:hypothetical protein